MLPAQLRRFTAARVGLGRVGDAQPTGVWLDFQEAHAAARDAVWSALDPAALGFSAPVVRSEARDRREYLLRPDLGRRLRAEDAALLPRSGGVVVVVADGLCAAGVQAQAASLLQAFSAPWPVVVALQARVALGDAIGAATGAEAVVVLIGERPGLSAQDSVGLYLTWAPRPGRTDAERNCISNIRPGGLSHAEAATKLHWLLREARALGATGIALKDEMPAGALPPPDPAV
ncbi:ethanolamine ammonia-lyase subunit EutC [Sabulicella glaciei]|uniref:Ethanolamine ammonia-lyase small subunit n=1 Tax=Sabulicella glaciei TaxID=2984948 RepID=A0ABT3NUW1_9PROT|nr:ethanolamine ammonia-lyase subunit EutC [Roseococcus sp. MDT2-1-1]MCW8085945.1 ethanolamine ammonia-lyase subunit EutC [Roseococcus sp. MDT2-1-1]